MKRSEINYSIESAIRFFKKMNFPLPPFAYFSPDDWHKKHADYKEVIECKLGWDVTDFGLNKFSKIGRTIFTLRNGRAGKRGRYPKTYAQKVMFLQENQLSPIHYHQSKMEDIINQGGGKIGIKIWEMTPHKKFSTKPVTVNINGSIKKFPAGKTITLNPGDSITLTPGKYHQFWAKTSYGPVLSMEISSVNDDINDNYWFGGNVRFPEITEDEPKKFVLCSEYNFFPTLRKSTPIV